MLFLKNSKGTPSKPAFFFFPTNTQLHKFIEVRVCIYKNRKHLCYLAIRNEANEYYLNGGWRIDFPRSLRIAGTVFHYQRKTFSFNTPESITALGPTNEPLLIVVSTSAVLMLLNFISKPTLYCGYGVGHRKISVFFYFNNVDRRPNGLYMVIQSSDTNKNN